MRLSEAEAKSIVNCVHSLDPDAQIYLYGSRTNSEARGGDIDLLIVSEKLGFSDKVTLLMNLKEELGDQKIDILIKPLFALKTDPFIASIIGQSILLK